MKNPRRARFVAYFHAELGGDRAKLIAKTGLTKGRITQLFDEDEPFGELAAENLARKLGLPSNAFLEQDRQGSDDGQTMPHQAKERPAAWAATSASSDALHVPLLANSASMGTGEDTLHDDVVVGTLSLSQQWLQRHFRPTSTGALRFIHAYGDSMTPTFSDGDVLLVDTGAWTASSR